MIGFFFFNSRGPSKYTRKWEDESAYAKQNSAPPPRNPRPEDFPELGSKGERRRPSHLEREEKENRSRQNYQIDDDNQNYSSRKRTSMRQISDRRGSDRRDGDRRDGDRRDSDRRDNSPRSRRQNDRYPSSETYIQKMFFTLLKINYLFIHLFVASIDRSWKQKR